MIDLKGMNLNLVRLLAQREIVGEKDLPAVVNYARLVVKLIGENPGEAMPLEIEQTVGLWQAIARLADAAGMAKPERQTCNNCRFMWDAPRSRPAETQREVDERVCTVDPPADKSRVCSWNRPACSRWEVK